MVPTNYKPSLAVARDANREGASRRKLKDARAHRSLPVTRSSAAPSVGSVVVSALVLVGAVESIAISVEMREDLLTSRSGSKRSRRC
jgi:hypothetical protein